MKRFRYVVTPEMVELAEEETVTYRPDLKSEVENLPKSLKDKGFRNFNITDENRSAYNMALNFANNTTEKKSLVFYGNVRTGKTHLAAAICKNLAPIINENKTHVIFSRSKVVFLIADEFFQKLNDSDNSKKSKMDMISDCLKNYDLVVLDGLGINNFTAAKQESLYLFINRVYFDEKRIILTTNFDMEELGKKDIRITDRLVEMAEIIKFTGESFSK